jgi:hypothetical protein
MKHVMLLLCSFLTIETVHCQVDDTLSIQLEDGSFSTTPSQMDTKDPSTLGATRDYAAERIEVRKFDQAEWRKIIESHNYTDSHKAKNRQTSPSSEQGRRIEDDGSRDDTYENDDADTDLSWLGPLGQILFYLIIAAIIVMIIVQVVQNTSFKANPKRTPATNDLEAVGDISELDTATLIQKAHNARDYKLAIRLYFLDLLKTLNENGTITWTKDKTNRDYLSELFSKQYYFDEMRRLTLAYERVWYGEHTPTEESYVELQSKFQEVGQKIKS